MKSVSILSLALVLGFAVAAEPTREKDQTRVTAAAEGGLAEVQFGKLAGKKATDPQVKSFGQTMVKDHSAASLSYPQRLTRPIRPPIKSSAG